MDQDFGFIEGFVFKNNRISVVISSAQLEEQNVMHAFIGNYKAGEWKTWDEDFDVIKVCVVGNKEEEAIIFEMGDNGEVMVIEPIARKNHKETISSPEGVPSASCCLNDIRKIGNNLYVAGMRRQVFRRGISYRGDWKKIDDGVFLKKESKEIAGFLSIDGFDESEIYAVGYGGQIWSFNGKKWRQIESPTNVRLESIRCMSNGIAVVVGDQGVILKGRGDQWKVITHDKTEETLTDVEMFKDDIYVSTETGDIFQLIGDNLLKVNTKVKKKITTGNLHSNAEILLSVGERDLLVFDGSIWSELPHPSLPAV